MLGPRTTETIVVVAVSRVVVVAIGRTVVPLVVVPGTTTGFDPPPFHFFYSISTSYSYASANKKLEILIVFNKGITNQRLKYYKYHFRNNHIP